MLCCAVLCCAVLCWMQVLPQGLAGAVGMWRNWTFTLFFCMSELWGDVCMGLLFWG
jgi:ATP/ADP translocase